VKRILLINNVSVVMSKEILSYMIGCNISSFRLFTFNIGSPGLKSCRITFFADLSPFLVIDGTDEGRSRLKLIEIYHFDAIPFARGKSIDDSTSRIAVQIKKWVGLYCMHYRCKGIVTTLKFSYLFSISLCLLYIHGFWIKKSFVTRKLQWI